MLLCGAARANLQAAARERQRAVFRMQALFDRNFGRVGLINLKPNCDTYTRARNFKLKQHNTTSDAVQHTNLFNGGNELVLDTDGQSICVLHLAHRGTNGHFARALFDIE